MDKLDKLIEIKLQELFEQWSRPAAGPTGQDVGWYNGAYAPSVPSRKAIGIDEEEHWKCSKCGYEIDAPLDVPEAGMGYIKCPNCGEAVTQDEDEELIRSSVKESNVDKLLSKQIDDIISRTLKEGAPDIVKKQRDRSIGKLAMQKSVKEDEFEVEPKEASKLHKALEKEHLDKMHKFDEVIKDLKGKMASLPKDSGGEYKKLHSMMSVNKVEQERHRQHAHSHRLCRVKHKKLKELYDKGIPSDEEIDKIIHIETV